MSSVPLIEPAACDQEEEEKRRGGGCLRRLIDAEEAKWQLRFSVPMIFTNMSYFAVTLVSVMFAGHLGDLELAGATLGNSWGTVTGLALMVSIHPLAIVTAISLPCFPPMHVPSSTSCGVCF